MSKEDEFGNELRALIERYISMGADMCSIAGGLLGYGTSVDMADDAQRRADKLAAAQLKAAGRLT